MKYVSRLVRDPGLLRAEESFLPTEQRLSSDSKASSGEVSPYDNNSPVLSDGRQWKYPEDCSPLSDREPILTGHSKDRSGSTSPTISSNKGELYSLRHIVLYYTIIYSCSK